MTFHVSLTVLCSCDCKVITSIGELVELCSPQIQSGWRPLFSALRTVHGSKSDMKDYLIGEYSMGQYNKQYINQSMWTGLQMIECSNLATHIVSRCRLYKSQPFCLHRQALVVEGVIPMSSVTCEAVDT